jgi:signal transduction histidine kinase
MVIKDLGQALSDKQEEIIQAWINAVQVDPDIESAQKLTYKAVRNSLPKILEQLALLLSQNSTGNLAKLGNKSEHHGFIRAEQGYDAAEIVDEYRLLRQILVSALEPELLTGTTADMLSSIRTIDDLLDSIIGNSLEIYIEAKLTEIRQIQGQLTLTNQELNRLVQAHKENISFMSHELKTPLNSIIGLSSVMLRKQRRKIQDKDTATNLDQLERVMRNGQALLRIINDTLEIARYNEGLIQLNLVPTNIGQLIQEIVEDGLEPLAQEKGLTLNIDISRAPQSINTDPLRIQQVVTNLVGNAIRYTDSGEIQIACYQTDSQFWVISVQDSGIGIAEEDQLRIFDPFVQSNSANQPSVMSTGLGLAIVQRIIQLLNARIEVRSEPEKGSLFIVTIPIDQA